MDEQPPAPFLRRFLGRLLGVLIVLGAAALSVYAYRLNFVHPRTDDAAVRANIVGIAPHVAGPIVQLNVVDNQPVKAGDLLFIVDPRPYEARLARMRADLALALKDVQAQQRAIASATERCLACRDRFTNEWNAERIQAFVAPFLGRLPAGPSRGSG